MQNPASKLFPFPSVGGILAGCRTHPQCRTDMQQGWKTGFSGYFTVKRIEYSYTSVGLAKSFGLCPEGLRQPWISTRFSCFQIQNLKIKPSFLPPFCSLKALQTLSMWELYLPAIRNNLLKPTAMISSHKGPCLYKWVRNLGLGY